MTKTNEMMTAKLLEGFGKVNDHGKTAALEYLNMLNQLDEYTRDESAMARYFKHIDPNTILDMRVMLGKVPCLEVIHGNNERHTFPLAEGWQVHICNEFLRSLNTSFFISFENFPYYGELVNMCMVHLQERKA